MERIFDDDVTKYRFNGLYFFSSSPSKRFGITQDEKEFLCKNATSVIGSRIASISFSVHTSKRVLRILAGQTCENG